MNYVSNKLEIVRFNDESVIVDSSPVTETTKFDDVFRQRGNLISKYLTKKETPQTQGVLFLTCDGFKIIEFFQSVIDNSPFS